MVLKCCRVMFATNEELSRDRDKCCQSDAPVLGQTQFYRERLLDQFSAWLKTQGLDFDSLVLSSTPDVEGINLLLEK